MRPVIRTDRRAFLATSCVVAAALAVGCEHEELGYYEVKRVDEVLTADDFADLASVLEAVPPEDRRRLPNPFAPPPRWADDRTLPVADLLREERAAAAEAWMPEEAAAALPATPVWEKALRRRGLTRPQFASLVLSAAASLGRLQADPRLSLSALATRGAREVSALAAERRTFASLSPEDRYATLSRASWLTTSDRAARLSGVPAENVALMEANRERLRELLPESFFKNPFEGLYPRAQDLGVPFEEGAVSDADLTWSAKDALVGGDPPDDLAESRPTGRH